MAKRKAKQGLKTDAGLTKAEARRQGISSGRERAKQLIKSESIPFKDAKRVAAFYNRFKNCRSSKCEAALNLWGGRSFGKRAVNHVRKNQ